MKKWYYSMVIWCNIIALILELLQLFADVNIIPSGTAAIIMAVLNIVLRYFKTSVPIG